MRIAYFFTELPAHEGTFPVAELEEMAARGFEIEIFCLRSRLAAGAGAECLRSRFPIHRSGYVAPRALLALLWLAMRHPFRFAAGLRSVIGDLAGHPSLIVKNLVILPKCCLFARRVRRGRYDLIWAYWASLPGRAAWWISRLSGVPYGTWTHAGNDIYNRRHQTEPALQTILSAASLVCTCNQTNLDYFRTILPDPVIRRVHYQPHGIDLARFEYVSRSIEAHLSGAGQEVPRLLSVGRLSPAKGFQQAIEACAILRDRGRPVRYRIIGAGPMRERLSQRIAELGLGGWVELPGEMPQERLPPEYRGADLFVMPSIVGDRGARDGLPNVLLEAMACGLPSVGSNAVGIPEAIVSGTTGLLAPPGDPRGLADAIERMLSDRAGAARMAAAARRLVEERFARGACMDQLAATFRRFHAERTS